MVELAREILAGEEAWVVGGALRDELLGRGAAPGRSCGAARPPPGRAARRGGARGPGPARGGGGPARAPAGLAARPAGERILAELERLSPSGFRRLDELGLLPPLGGSLERGNLLEAFDSPDFRLAVVFGAELRRYPISNERKRFLRALLRAERPPDRSARAIHRFRRAAEPWALEALAFVGASELAPEVEAARAADPDEPLLRGDELGLLPGPEIGRLLAAVEEERAAGLLSTREEALEFVRRSVSGS